MQDNFFDAPPEGAIQQGYVKAKSLTYKACKTPEAYASHADAAAAQQQGHLGFSYYDAENRTKVQVPELTFVVLEMYAGVSGYDGASTSYWSNRVRDTRNEPLVVFSSASPKMPILSGYYAKKQHIDGVATVGGQPIPAGAGFTVYAKAWCVQLNEVIEIELSSGVQQGMKIAISDADARAGRRTDPEKVFLLSIANSDYLWGFHLFGYEKTGKDWQPYTGKGDLFFRPVFQSGILNAQKSLELHETCVREQNAERARHDAYKSKYAAVEASKEETQPTRMPSPDAVGNTAQPYDLPANPNVRANHDLQNGDPLAGVTATPGRVQPEQPFDDLPF